MNELTYEVLREGSPEDIQIPILLNKYVRELDYDDLIKLCFKADISQNYVLREVRNRVWQAKVDYLLTTYTPEELLKESAKSNRPIYVLLLLSRGTEYEPYGLLNYAAKHGHLNILKCVLRTNDTAESMLSHALEEAVLSGNIEIVKFILCRFRILGPYTFEGAFKAAIATSNLVILDLIVQHKLQVRGSISPEQIGKGIKKAAKICNVDIVNYLLNLGVAIPRDKSSSAIKIAHRHKCHDLIKILWGYVIELCSRDRLVIPHFLDTASRLGYLPFLEAVGSFVKIQHEIVKSALSIAIYSNHWDVVDYFIKSDAKLFRNSLVIVFKRAAEQAKLHTLRLISDRVGYISGWDLGNSIEEALKSVRFNGDTDTIKYILSLLNLHNTSRFRDKLEKTAMERSIRKARELGFVEIAELLEAQIDV